MYVYVLLVLECTAQPTAHSTNKGRRFYKKRRPRSRRGNLEPSLQPGRTCSHTGWRRCGRKGRIVRLYRLKRVFHEVGDTHIHIHIFTVCPTYAHTHISTLRHLRTHISPTVEGRCSAMQTPEYATHTFALDQATLRYNHYGTRALSSNRPHTTYAHTRAHTVPYRALLCACLRHSCLRHSCRAPHPHRLAPPSPARANPLTATPAAHSPPRKTRPALPGTAAQTEHRRHPRARPSCPHAARSPPK